MVGKEAIPGILEAMENGESLRKACGAFGTSVSAFLKWVSLDKDLEDQYTQARARLLDVRAEELEDIGERAASAENAVEVAGLRLLSDNRKWLLSKLSPKKYGDKLQTELSGGFKVQAVTDLSDDDLASIASGSGG